MISLSFSLGQWGTDALFGAVIGGVVGGVTSAIDGTNPWNGNPKVQPRGLTPAEVDPPGKINTEPAQTDKALKSTDHKSGSLTPANPDQNTNFTKNNFRKNLIKKTGIDPGKTAHAHHDIPQAFRKEMAKFGINVDDPKYGRWWKVSTHQNNASAFNYAWKSFLREVPNPSRIQVHRWVIAMRQRYPTGITGY